MDTKEGKKQEVREMLDNEVKMALKAQERKTSQLEEELKISKRREAEIENQLHCKEHDMKVDAAIMGGYDIETCRKCGATWYC